MSPFPEDQYRFRVEQVDDRGNILRHIPVELRASEIPGLVFKEGNSVILRGRMGRRGLFTAKEIYVVETGLSAKVKGFGFWKTVLYLPIGLAFLLSWIALPGSVIAFFVTGDAAALAVTAIALVAMALYWRIYLR